MGTIIDPILLVLLLNIHIKIVVIKDKVLLHPTIFLLLLLLLLLVVVELLYLPLLPTITGINPDSTAVAILTLVLGITIQLLQEILPLIQMGLVKPTITGVLKILPWTVSSPLFFVQNES